MMSYTDVNIEYFNRVSNILKNSFERKNFAFNSFMTIDDANSFLLSNIKKNDIITFGGSATLGELNIFEKLKTYKNFIDRNNKDLKSEAEIKAFSSDIYLSSANAISKTGDIVVIDGSGNRVASIIYGPKKVFLICGINKVVDTEEDAIKRAKTIAATKNSIRFGLENSCNSNDMICDNNCSVDSRLCAYTGIINKSHIKERIHIVLINEFLGF